jgi:glutathione S-transferase
VVKVRLGMSDASEDDISSALKPGLERLSEFITIIESLMSQDHSHFTFGSHPTWADLFLYPMVADLEATPEAHALTPRLRAWSEKMKTLPAVRNTVEGTLAAQRNV